ncbi:hypothetical protein HGA05_08360 [Gordonia polyisoprenivorans]|uniref:Integral membrane protein n=1 Tax=Gordonia polyisoprenivorans TaxID=84595 RepID=A0A846WMS3_9ACTN|nr:hypothetical protein [Gordonia polyisoprenivorans]
MVADVTCLDVIVAPKPQEDGDLDAGVSSGGDAADRAATPSPVDVTYPTVGGGRSRLRSVGAALLTVVSVVLVVLTLLAGYLRSDLLDTDGYVAMVAPLASDPAIRAEVTDALVTVIDDHVDIAALSAEAFSALTPGTGTRAAQVLSPLIAAQLQSYLHDTVERFVSSSAFATAWTTANRAAHATLDRLLAGDTGIVAIDLAPMVARIRQRLIDDGFTAAEQIPAIHHQVVLWQSDALRRAQRAVSALNTAALVLPWMTALAIIATIGVAAPTRRWRAVMGLGLGITTVMLLLAVASVVARGRYLDAVPADVITPDAARAVFDTVVAPLRTRIWVVAVVGAVPAVLAFVAERRGWPSGRRFHPR